MKIQNIFRYVILVAVIILNSLVSTNAQTEEAPLLTINVEGVKVASFNYDQLEIMNSVTFETTTIWTDGKQTFQGVPLKGILDQAGIQEGVILATAVNNYAVEIPVSEITEEAPIIAYKLNGERMSLRDKGPLWVVYPYDKSSRFQTDVIYSRSIWQLNRLNLK